MSPACTHLYVGDILQDILQLLLFPAEEIPGIPQCYRAIALEIPADKLLAAGIQIRSKRYGSMANSRLRNAIPVEIVL